MTFDLCLGEWLWWGTCWRRMNSDRGLRLTGSWSACGGWDPFPLTLTSFFLSSSLSPPFLLFTLSILLYFFILISFVIFCFLSCFLIPSLSFLFWSILIIPLPNLFFSHPFPPTFYCFSTNSINPLLLFLITLSSFQSPSPHLSSLSLYFHVSLFIIYYFPFF